MISPITGRPIAPPLPTGPYAVVLSDPPWHYDGRVQHGGSGVGYTSGAETHYPTMSMTELRALRVADMYDPEGTIHFMWTTGPQLHNGVALLEAWGCRYKTVAFAWEKMRVNPGSYTMSSAEFVLVGTHRRIPQPRGARNVRQWLEEPEVIHELRTVHSRKPATIRDRIVEMFPEQRRVELFARDRAPGWDAWGNEV